jgi:hypothetical protein
MAQSMRLPPAGRKLVAAYASEPTRNAAQDKGWCSRGGDIPYVRPPRPCGNGGKTRGMKPASP